jgi:CheY-like chemotaxis protein
MVRNVLFVDDDQIMLLAIEKRFASFSDYFSIVKANDGFEAVQKLKDTSISLIVLDLKMPRMDGMSLLSHAREKYPDIPVIIVSGYRTAEMYKLAKAKGVIAYISKPFQVDDLGKIIMSTLQKEADGGIMHNVSPTVFLQLMEMEAKTCTIRILNKKTGMGGILYFIDGSLLDARVGEVKGLDAAYKLFGWDDVTIFIQNECAPIENVINSPLQPIIMKAVGMKDEEEEPVVPDQSELSDVAKAAAEAELQASLNEDLGSLDLPEEFFESDELGEALDPPNVAKKQQKAPAVKIKAERT